MDGPSSGAANQRIKFENPPINELVIGLFHLPIVELKAQHIGLYWERIRERYPLCEQQPIIVVNPLDTKPFPEVPGEPYPLPRFWFFREGDPLLVQVQRDAFFLNWRRRGGNDYPHYETVIQDFWQEFEIYKHFVQEWGGEGLDVIRRCELNYINFIAPNDVFTNPAQLRNVLPPIASLSDMQAADRQMVGLNAAVTYKVHTTLQIDMAIQLGHRSDTKELAAILDLKAYGAPSDLSLAGTQAWYDAAHDAIYTIFLTATSREVQEHIWKPL